MRTERKMKHGYNAVVEGTGGKQDAGAASPLLFDFERSRDQVEEVFTESSARPRIRNGKPTSKASAPSSLASWPSEGLATASTIPSANGSAFRLRDMSQRNEAEAPDQIAGRYDEQTSGKIFKSHRGSK